MKRLSGFSLMEMMIVLLIVAIVAAASAPMVNKKMVSQAGDKTPWIWTNLNNSIAFNINNSEDQTVSIGTFRSFDKARLYIETRANVSNRVLPQIAFGYSANNSRMRMSSADGRFWVTSKFLPSSTNSRNSIVIGNDADITAMGEATVVIGYNATASNRTQVVIGNNARSTVISSVAIGDGANITGEESIVLGHSAKAESSQAVVMGTNAHVSTSSAFGMAVGMNASSSSPRALAIGAKSNASGNNSIAIGAQDPASANSTTASAAQAIAIGFVANAAGNNAVAIGNAATSTSSGIAIGPTTQAANLAVALGSNARATNVNSVALGHSANAAHQNSVAIGAGAATTSANEIMLGSASHTVKINGGTVAQSDRRLKNVGEPFKGGLAEIKMMQPVNFTYKSDKTKKPRVGVIAQDLQKIFPKSVTKDGDGYLSIRTEEIFYALVNAVKELDVKITTVADQVKTNISNIVSIQKRLDAQEKRIQALEKRLAELEKNK